ncbi:uncharacterized protein LOC128218073 [Mya arenaria]|uniref:uncharacterized protein LOC128218073 n=1 Tax=Mya arenaria TaxID=6604 RepID=UPI0022E18C55|nr:uncharacterized protein LOC128218073 [Mya arenaria]
MRCSVRCRRPQCRDIDLQHSRPTDFITSKFLSPWFGLVWSVIWLLFFTTTLLLDVFYSTRKEHRKYWLLYLRNWSYCLMSLTLTCETTVRLLGSISSNRLLKGARMPVILKVQWILYSTNNVVAVTHTVMHVSILYEGLDFETINKVLLTTIYVITNSVFVTRIPVKFLHCYQAPVFILFHAITCAVYQSSKQSSDFRFYLDWSRPNKSGAILVIVIVVSIIVHCVFFSIYKLLVLLYKRFFSGVKEIPDDIGSVENLHRHATATDVVIDEIRTQEEVDFTPNTKDDLDLKASSSERDEEFNKRCSRLFKSESDLGDYRTKNGLYCDFLDSRVLFHNRRMSDVGQMKTRTNISPRVTVIVVQKYCEEDEMDDSESCDLSFDSTESTQCPQDESL